MNVDHALKSQNIIKSLDVKQLKKRKVIAVHNGMYCVIIVIFNSESRKIWN